MNIYTQESSFEVFYTKFNNRSTPFPDYARGFFYLHSPAAEPEAMWEIRFRITDNNCPSSFNSGSDLQYSNGTTWAISLGSLHPRTRKYLALRELLLRDGVDIDALLSKMGAVKRKTSTSIPLIDHTLDQRFRVDFQNTEIRATFINFDEQLLCRIYRLFTTTHQTQDISPYSGTSYISSLDLFSLSI